MIHLDTLSTSLGELIIGCSNVGVRFIQRFASKEDAQKWIAIQNKHTQFDLPNHLTKQVAQDIQSYLAGKLKTWSVVPLDLEEGTALQRSVWDTIYHIPYGKTISYTELANKVKKPKAVRAAASACGKNPIPLIIPCHRVLAKDGTLGGFGWGLEIKRQLLDLEHVA